MSVILGPCPCKHCGASVFWGRREYQGVTTGDARWRDPSDAMPHICLGTTVITYIEAEIERLTEEARAIGIAV